MQDHLPDDVPHQTGDTYVEDWHDDADFKNEVTLNQPTPSDHYFTAAPDHYNGQKRPPTDDTVNDAHGYEYTITRPPHPDGDVVPKKSRKPRTPKDSPREKKPIKMEQCDVCGAISRSLKTHMMTHTNEKKFECDFCGRKFSLRSSIKNHLFAHINIR